MALDNMLILFILKLGILCFWGLWFFIALSTNVCESFKALKLFSKIWPFASGNLHEVIQSTKTYSLPRWLPRLLFSGVLLWELVIVSCFGWAIMSSAINGAINTVLVNTAFVAGLGLWGGFIIADEIFKQYDTEHSHILFFIGQLVTLATFYVLPS